MKITSDGQITIPDDIRDPLGLTPDTEVEFEVVGDTLYLRKTVVGPFSDSDAVRAAARIRAWAEKAGGTADLGGMSTSEFMKSMRSGD